MWQLANFWKTHSLQGRILSANLSETKKMALNVTAFHDPNCFFDTTGSVHHMCPCDTNRWLIKTRRENHQHK